MTCLNQDSDNNPKTLGGNREKIEEACNKIFCEHIYIYTRTLPFEAFAKPMEVTSESAYQTMRIRWMT